MTGSPKKGFGTNIAMHPGQQLYGRDHPPPSICAKIINLNSAMSRIKIPIIRFRRQFIKPDYLVIFFD
ncbi:hypothetical protein KY284_001169 [Solanum tuberosum]|nr:hypothetical protein KY284_001169 [Solanum tuberosum]